MGYHRQKFSSSSAMNEVEFEISSYLIPTTITTTTDNNNNNIPTHPWTVHYTNNDMLQNLNHKIKH